MYENDMKIIERAQNGSKEDMTKLIIKLIKKVIIPIKIRLSGRK